MSDYIPVPVVDPLTRDERRLLVYMEAHCVDNYGALRADQLNADDHALINQWIERGFIRFGRISAQSISEQRKRRGSSIAEAVCAYWCELSDQAWSLAHAERRARFERMKNDRWFTRTEELREEVPA